MKLNDKHGKKMEKQVEFPIRKLKSLFSLQNFLTAKILLMASKFPGITSSHIFLLQRNLHLYVYNSRATGGIYIYREREVPSFNKRGSETVYIDSSTTF